MYNISTVSSVSVEVVNKIKFEFSKTKKKKHSGSPPYGYRVKVVENSFHHLDFDGSLLPLFIT